jgi:hypothetical protein
MLICQWIEQSKTTNPFWNRHALQDTEKFFLARIMLLAEVRIHWQLVTSTQYNICKSFLLDQKADQSNRNRSTTHNGASILARSYVASATATFQLPLHHQSRSWFLVSPSLVLRSGGKTLQFEIFNGQEPQGGREPPPHRSQPRPPQTSKFDHMSAPLSGVQHGQGKKDLCIWESRSTHEEKE